MKRSSIKKFLTLVFAALFIMSCQTPDSQEEAVEESFGAAPVKVYKVRRQRISENLFYMGQIEASKEINITPDVAGKIASIHVEEGDRVQQGQLLAELDRRHVRASRDRAGDVPTDGRTFRADRPIVALSRFLRHGFLTMRHYLLPTHRVSDAQPGLHEHGDGQPACRPERPGSALRGQSLGAGVDLRGFTP